MRDLWTVHLLFGRSGLDAEDLPFGLKGESFTLIGQSVPYGVG